MIERETVQCSHGDVCDGDHHGWDCPLSDPQGDVLRALMDPHPNPILEASRKAMVERWLGVP